MKRIRRLRPTTAAKLPNPKAPEGVKAAWWREHVMRLSRPALAERFGITSATVANYEAAETVPTMYRLACGALSAGVGFDWLDTTIEPNGRVQVSVTREAKGRKA